MNIVIIEDERFVADDLEDSIRELYPKAVDINKVFSVKEAIAYLKSGEAPDLIFSDIQLGDGLSFEIFAAVPLAVPVVFCTAYDEYAINAFKANGIDYILKPFTQATLQAALNKYNRLKQLFSPASAPSYDAILQLLNHRDAVPTASSLLVYHKDKIIPIKLEDIALIYLESETSHVLTFNGKVYYPNKTLDELEKICGDRFFRASRQVLICRKAITDVSNYFSRKLLLNLSLPFSQKITVSKSKTPAFLQWLTQK